MSAAEVPAAEGWMQGTASRHSRDLARSLVGVDPKRVLAALLVFTVGWWVVANAVWISALAGDRPIYVEPQGNVRALLASEWVAEGRPAYELERYDDLPPDIAVALTPRDGALLDGEVVPKDHAYAVVAAALVSPLGPVGFGMLAMVLSLSAALVVGATTRAITGSVLTGAVAVALAQVSLIWWSASFGGVSFAPATIVFGLGAIVVLLNYRSRRLPLPGPLANRFLVAGFLGGIASGFHYGTLPWWFGLLLAACIGSSASLPEIVRRLASTGLGGFIGVLPILLFNWWMYGSPTATGYTVFDDILQQIDWNGTNVGFSMSSFEQNIRTYGLRPELLPVLIASYFGIRALPRNGLRLRWQQWMAVSLGGVLLVAISGGSTVWGTGSFQTNSSFLRYLAPVFACLFVVAAIGLAGWWRSDNPLLRLGSVAFAVLYGAISVVSIVQLPNGILASRDLVAASEADLEAVLRIVPEDGMVITRRMDKVLFPDRTVLIAAYLRTSTPPSDTPVHLYGTWPDADRLAEVITRLAGESVFLMNNAGWVSEPGLARLTSLLADEGICVTETDLAELIRFAPCGDDR